MDLKRGLVLIFISVIFLLQITQFCVLVSSEFFRVYFIENLIIGYLAGYILKKTKKRNDLK